MADIVKKEQQQETGLQLPAYSEVTETKVIKQLQDVFKGFEYEPELNLEAKFKTAEQVEAYVSNVAEDIRKADTDFKIQEVQNKGAIEARRWYFGWFVSKALSSAQYGSDMASKLAKAANISVAYLYQYRAVGDRLSLKDVYILGMYDLGWELIREIAALSDPAYRQGLIQLYIKDISDYNNKLKREQARMLVRNALDQLKKAPEALTIESPAQLEELDKFATEAPEFILCEKEVDKLKTRIRGFIKEKNLAPYYKACADCYIPDSAPSAQERLEGFQVSVSEALELMKKLEETIPLITQELQSLQAMKVLKADAKK